jgi:hypothetical protein
MFGEDYWQKLDNAHWLDEPTLSGRAQRWQTLAVVPLALTGKLSLLLLAAVVLALLGVAKGLCLVGRGLSFTGRHLR